MPPQWIKNINQYYGKIRIKNLSFKFSINKVGDENIKEVPVTLVVPQLLKNIDQYRGKIKIRNPISIKHSIKERC